MRFVRRLEGKEGVSYVHISWRMILGRGVGVSIPGALEVLAECLEMTGQGTDVRQDQTGSSGNCNNTGFYSGRPYLIHILKGSDWLLWRNSECSYVTGISQDRSTGGLDEVSAPNQIHTNIGVFSAKR